MSKDLDSTGDFEIEPRGSPSFPSLCLGAIFFPCTLVGSWIFVQEQEEAVVLSFGKYHEVLRSSGCHFSNCVGRELRRVSKRKTSIDLPETKVVDRNGNPLLISGIVVYHIGMRMPKRSVLLETKFEQHFSELQARSNRYSKRISIYS